MTELNWIQRNCPSCQAGLKATDRFCRRCGIRQTTQEWAAPGFTSGLRVETGPRADAVTNGLAEAQTLNAARETNPLSRPVSAPLLKALANGVALEGAMSGYSKITRNIVLALMSVPVWLMIILLSPLDAWTATRAMTR